MRGAGSRSWLADTRPRVAVLALALHSITYKIFNQIISQKILVLSSATKASSILLPNRQNLIEMT